MKAREREREKSGAKEAKKKKCHSCTSADAVAYTTGTVRRRFIYIRRIKRTILWRLYVNESVIIGRSVEPTERTT